MCELWTFSSFVGTKIHLCLVDQNCSCDIIGLKKIEKILDASPQGHMSFWEKFWESNKYMHLKITYGRKEYM